MPNNRLITPITQDYATRDKTLRAIAVLNNHQLLMKYALTNDQVSQLSIDVPNHGLMKM